MHKVIAKSILSTKNEMNIYKGCTHGCIYCDSRNKNYHIEDFTDVEVKENAPELLEAVLKRKKDKIMVSMGTLSDPYVHCEQELGLTKECLEIIAKYDHGVTLLTKSDLVLRDIEILKQINQKAKCVVGMTITTFDDNLCKIIEPGVCPTSRRVAVLKELAEAGIPTIVWITPLLPFINDTEENIKKILELVLEVKAKGIIYYGPGMTLREGTKEYYFEALDKHYPLLRRRYQRDFKGKSEIYQNSNVFKFDYIIKDFCEKNDIMYDPDDVFYFTSNMDRNTVQLSIFDEEINEAN